MSGLVGKLGEDGMQKMACVGDVVGVVHGARNFDGNDEGYSIPLNQKFRDQNTLKLNDGLLCGFDMGLGRVGRADTFKANRELVHDTSPITVGCGDQTVTRAVRPVIGMSGRTRPFEGATP